ncbi:MAG: DMT family transporter [Hyphomicrobiales bacterium]
MTGLSIETRAKLACLLSGVVWGVFWVPLRALEDVGVHGIWGTVVFFAIPELGFLPVIFWRRDRIRSGGAGLQATAFLSAASLTVYAIAIMYTDVVRAMLLFYLTPLWSALLARIVLGEPITPVRMLAMAIAIVGLLTIFGLGATFPVPQNVGDWLGFSSGLLWAITAVRLRGDRTNHSLDITACYFVWSVLIALTAALLVAPEALPRVSQYGPLLPWLVPMMVFVVMPGAYAAAWGPKYLNPGLVGILFMTEISVGATTAAIWSGDPFGWREFAGIILIAGAALLESMYDLYAARRNSVTSL